MDFTTYIDPAQVHTEDNGQTRYVTLEADGRTSGLFVELHSWDERPGYHHPEFTALVGQRVRVRIEPELP